MYIPQEYQPPSIQRVIWPIFYQGGAFWPLGKLVSWRFESSIKSAQAGKIKPIIAERMPLNEAPKAHELLKTGSITGKNSF